MLSRRSRCLNILQQAESTAPPIDLDDDDIIPPLFALPHVPANIDITPPRIPRTVVDPVLGSISPGPGGGIRHVTQSPPTWDTVRETDTYSDINPLSDTLPPPIRDDGVAHIILEQLGLGLPVAVLPGGGIK